MYGILPTTDLSFLRDKTLIQVCFGPHDLQLRFDEENTIISVESSIGYGVTDGTYSERSMEPQEGVVRVHNDPCPLLRLLMKKVTDVSWTAEGTLTLEFEGAARLQIYDSAPYESYNIMHNDDFLVI